MFLTAECPRSVSPQSLVSEMPAWGGSFLVAWTAAIVCGEGFLGCLMLFDKLNLLVDLVEHRNMSNRPCDIDMYIICCRIL